MQRDTKKARTLFGCPAKIDKITKDYHKKMYACIFSILDTGVAPTSLLLK